MERGKFMAKVIGRLVLPDSMYHSLGSGDSEEQNNSDPISRLFHSMFGILMFFLFLVTIIAILIPRTSSYVMFETQMTSNHFYPASSHWSGKVHVTDPARYQVCFPYENRTYCSDNTAMYQLYEKGFTKIVVYMELIKEQKSGKLVDYSVKSIIQDKD